MNSNLSKILIHNFPIDKHISFKFSNCIKRSCNYCPLANTNSFLKLNNFYWPIMCMIVEPLIFYILFIVLNVIVIILDKLKT